MSVSETLRDFSAIVCMHGFEWCRNLWRQFFVKNLNIVCDGAICHNPDPLSCMDVARTLSFHRLCILHSGYHSDGAPTNYLSTSTMKDAFTAGIHLQRSPCCRPEAPYHVDQLQTCFACSDAAGRPHPDTCPAQLYGRPDHPNRPARYQGPTPAAKERSLYEVIIHCGMQGRSSYDVSIR